MHFFIQPPFIVYSLISIVHGGPAIMKFIGSQNKLYQGTND